MIHFCVTTSLYIVILVILTLLVARNWLGRLDVEADVYEIFALLRNC